MTNLILPRRKLIVPTLAAGLVAASPVMAKPALILSPAIAERWEKAGVVAPSLMTDPSLAMFMMARMALARVGASEAAVLKPQDVFDIQLGTASALDGLSTTGWDLLIGKSRVNATGWSWRNSVSGLSTTLASNSTAAAAAFSSYSTLLGSGNGVLTRIKRAAKFFDVGTYTGTGSPMTIAHALVAAPGMMIIKNCTVGGDWLVYHRILSPNGYIYLNSTGAYADGPYAGYFNNTAPTSTVFSVGSDSYVNGSGHLHVAYLFAHDPDPSGIVQCGSFTTDGSGNGSFATGWANGAQFAQIKCSSTTGDWEMFDTARTPSFSGSDARLRANLSNAEDSVARVSQSAGTLSFAGLSASQTYVGLFIREPI